MNERENALDALEVKHMKDVERLQGPMLKAGLGKELEVARTRHAGLREKVKNVPGNGDGDGGSSSTGSKSSSGNDELIELNEMSELNELSEMVETLRLKARVKELEAGQVLVDRVREELRTSQLTCAEHRAEIERLQSKLTLSTADMREWRNRHESTHAIHKTEMKSKQQEIDHWKENYGHLETRHREHVRKHEAMLAAHSEAVADLAGEHQNQKTILAQSHRNETAELLRKQAMIHNEALRVAQEQSLRYKVQLEEQSDALAASGHNFECEGEGCNFYGAIGEVRLHEETCPKLLSVARPPTIQKRPSASSLAGLFRRLDD